MKEKFNIYQKINAVMKEVDYIQKGDKKVNNQYNFVSHDQVTAKLHPALTKHGIVVLPSVLKMIQDGNRTVAEIEVSFVNIDDPQDKFSVLYTGYGIDAGDKGPGKAISYAFKYAMLKTFVLETGDDPDNDQNVVYEPPKTEEELRKEKEEYNKKVKEKGEEFLKRFPDSIHVEIKEYLQEYSKLWHKKDMLLTLEYLENYEKFIQEFENWRLKKTKMKKAA